ncbi:MAG: hypothetical protein JW959_01565 [Pirellulales bacterium]|nr:hypothetical protein [Pirellulales bacterium]
MLSRFHVVGWAVLFVMYMLFCGCSDNYERPGQKDEITPQKDRSEDSTWHSQHHNVEISIPEGWKKTFLNKPGDTYDTPAGLLVGLGNKKHALGYMIKIDKDAPKDKLSDDVYYSGRCPFDS